MRIDPKRQRARLTKAATQLATLIRTDAPEIIVANRIAVFVRESSRLYGETLVRELGIVLEDTKGKGQEHGR
ncbi:MAG: hypothetical protein ABIP48_01320 [Planctomycetota bacterium]